VAAGSKFEVHVSGYRSSAEEWKRAFEAIASELPPLTDQEREIARRFQVSEEDYKRGKLAGILGQKGLEVRGHAFGDQVQYILSGLGDGYHLKAVFWEGQKLRWILRIETPHKLVAVAVPFELADDVLDSAAIQDIERLKNLVLLGVGRQELIGKRSA